MVSIKFKELFEPIVMSYKRRRVFALFKSISWETDLWIPLCDFTLNNAKLELGKSLYYKKSILSRTKCENFDCVLLFAYCQKCVAINLKWTSMTIKIKSTGNFLLPSDWIIQLQIKDYAIMHDIVQAIC